ncbi:hypothetical protein JTE90_021466 [Oedothorax gibbosus]|uniref:Uncharacterized protein n=1 Tax=Oedothorax gibbosus TaxID=931172 RepID=A0AAV6VWL8_9ARAC|nr:hypothetical protein JTE90_021466 [Oedothorax gibbosus]
MGKYRSFKAYARAIFKASLITSFPEIASTKSPIKMIVKIVVFIICTIGFSYQTLSFVGMYLAYPTVVNVKISYPFIVEQPGITICNSNRIRRKYFCANQESACAELLPPTFCDLFPKYCPEGDASIADPVVPYFFAVTTPIYVWEETKLSSHNTTMFVKCTKSFGNDESYCKLPYQSVPSVTLDGYQNYCFTVESQWGNKSAQPDKFINYFNLQLQMDTQLDDYMMYKNPVRIHVVLHDRKERVNTYVSGFTLEGGVRYVAHVSMVSTQRLPYPYDTNCTHYIDLWRKNNGTGPLSKIMCVEQCKMNKLVNMNSCVDKTVTYPHEEKLCEKEEIKVTEEMLESCYKECGSACKYE